MYPLLSLATNSSGLPLWWPICQLSYMPRQKCNLNLYSSLYTCVVMLVLLLNINNRKCHAHMFGDRKASRHQSIPWEPGTNITSNYFSVNLNLPNMCMTNCRVMTELTIVLLVTNANIIDWVWIMEDIEESISV